MLYPYKMEPAYKDYIWGGQNLFKLGKKVPPGRIAESWEVSTIPGNESKIANGPLLGTKFSDIIKKHGHSILGNTFKNELPLLIKFIDASRNLSVQVHPDDDYAFKNEHKKLGKTEMWYIIDAKPGATIIHGFAKELNKDEIKDAILNCKHEGIYKEIPVKKGDMVFIPSGTVHALNEGIIVAEIQQHSDLTYRIFDYNRIDSSGKKRPLHINKALDALNFDMNQNTDLFIRHDNDNTTKYLATCKHFCVRFIENNKTQFKSSAEGSFSILIFLSGHAKIDNQHDVVYANAWETVFIPAYMGKYSISGNFVALQVFLPNINAVDNIFANTANFCEYVNLN